MSIFDINTNKTAFTRTNKTHRAGYENNERKKRAFAVECVKCNLNRFIAKEETQFSKNGIDYSQNTHIKTCEHLLS